LRRTSPLRSITAQPILEPTEKPCLNKCPFRKAAAQPYQVTLFVQTPVRTNFAGGILQAKPAYFGQALAGSLHAKRDNVE